MAASKFSSAQISPQGHGNNAAGVATIITTAALKPPIHERVSTMTKQQPQATPKNEKHDKKQEPQNNKPNQQNKDNKAQQGAPNSAGKKSC
jgi:hypothetical protein